MEGKVVYTEEKSRHRAVCANILIWKAEKEDVKMIISTVLSIVILIFLLSLILKLTGLVAKGLIWLCVLLPIVAVLWSLAIVCCATIILIPVGLWLFRAGIRLLT